MHEDVYYLRCSRDSFMVLSDTALCRDAISIYAVDSSARICRQPWLLMTGRFVTARLAVSQKYALPCTVLPPVNVRLLDIILISILAGLEPSSSGLRALSSTNGGAQDRLDPKRVLKADVQALVQDSNDTGLPAVRLPDLFLQRDAALAYRYAVARPHPSLCMRHFRNIHHSQLRCLRCKEHVCTRGSGRPSPCCSLQAAFRLLPQKARVVFSLTRPRLPAVVQLDRKAFPDHWECLPHQGPLGCSIPS